MNDGLSDERARIFAQFMVFFLAFTTKTGYCVYQAIDQNESIVDEVILLGLWVPWHVVPSSFVFFTHHMAYKNMANFFGIALGLIVLMTMLQITVSIQLLKVEISVTQANCMRWSLIIVSVLTLILYFTAQVAIFVSQRIQGVYLYYVESATTAFLAILFSVTITYFSRKV